MLVAFVQCGEKKKSTHIVTWSRRSGVGGRGEADAVSETNISMPDCLLKALIDIVT